MPDVAANKTEELLGRTERKLDRIYKQAAKETKEKYIAYIEKYKKELAVKQAELASGKITDEQYQNWIQRKVFSGKKYQEMARTLAEDLTMTDQKAMSIVNGFLPEAYAMNYNFMAYQMDVAGVPMGASYTLYDRHVVEKLVRERKAVLPKPRVDIPKDQKWNVTHIKNAITQGVLQGESIQHISKRLEKVVGMDKASAYRNARTAMTGAQNGGRVDRMKDAHKRGINVWKEWCTTHDGRARDSHLDIDGERVPPDATFSNGCVYPGDPVGDPAEVYNCRCTLLPWLPDYDFDRREVERGIDSVSFDEWQESEVSDELKRINDAIANAQEYDYNWHEENDFSWDKWNALTDSERKGIVDYTDYYYDDMNEAMRSGDIYLKGERIANKIIDADRAMEHFELPEDMKLYRGMGKQRSLARALGISEDDLNRAISDESIVGMRFSENGFCSTAASWNKAWHKPIMLDIVAPKGTKGMYVDLISENSGEKEIMLQNGTLFEILGVDTAAEHRGRFVTMLRVVVVGNNKIPGL